MMNVSGFLERVGEMVEMMDDLEVPKFSIEYADPDEDGSMTLRIQFDIAGGDSRYLSKSFEEFEEEKLV